LKSLDPKESLRNKVGRKFRKYCQLRDLVKLSNGDIVAHCLADGYEEIIYSSYQLKKWHASHYWNEDRYESVALNEDNVNLCCYRCNRKLSGNKSAYEENLRTKIGDERFDELKILKNEIKKYSYGELQELDRKYSAKIKVEQERLGKKW
jgi:hypothetical protein